MNKLKIGTTAYEQVKTEILALHSVMSSKSFQVSVADDVRQRIDFLKNYLKVSGRKAYVLGISGGVDSSFAGRLCQLACNELREEGYPAKFVAVRLPAGVQKDEEDAQRALKFIQPDVSLVVNIGEAASALSNQGVMAFKSEGNPLTDEQVDYNKGNIKARLRMTAQYQIAAMYEGLVVGTEITSELVTAFFTRWGDQACDVNALNEISKRQVRLALEYLGADEKIWKKTPTADLEELNPGKPDSEGFGFPYDALDDFLEGLDVVPEVEELIVNLYNNTRFKRDGSVCFSHK